MSHLYAWLLLLFLATLAPAAGLHATILALVLGAGIVSARELAAGDTHER